MPTLRNTNLMYLTSHIMTHCLCCSLKFKGPSHFLLSLSLSLSASLPHREWIYLPLFEDVFQTFSWQWFMCQIQYISNKPGLDRLNPIWWEIKLMWNAFTKAMANLILSTQSPWLLTQHMWGFVTPHPPSSHSQFSLISSYFPPTLFHTDTATRNRCPRFNKIYYFVISVFVSLPAALQRLSKSFKRGSRGKRHNLYSEVN